MFKLGRSRQPYAVNGEIKNKLKFHQESGDPDISVPGTPIIRKDLEDGILGEANADGSIYLSNKSMPGSLQERYTLKHEMIHAKDMKKSPNKLSYEDDYIRYNGRTYPRKNIKGKDMILDVEKGKWKEAGSHDFPWEKDANNI